MAHARFSPKDSLHSRGPGLVPGAGCFLVSTLCFVRSVKARFAGNPKTEQGARLTISDPAQDVTLQEKWGGIVGLSPLLCP